MRRHRAYRRNDRLTERRHAVYDEVLKRARKYGVSIGTGMHASNINCGSFYAWRMAEDNVVGIVMSNTFPAMSPYGSADRLLGTNPIIMGCPAGEEYPMVLDISTSNVAMGKVMAYRREGKPLPLGWANDINGVPTTDAAKAYSAVPITTYKGSGLAIFVDVFGALLSNACYGSDIKSVAAMVPENTGFAVILVDIEKFMPIDVFKQSADRYIRMMKGSRKAEGFDEIFMPGEIEYRKKAENIKTGLSITDTLCDDLFDLGIAIGALNPGQSFEGFVSSL
ncbi:MAG: Ldh family oxidoreductase [Clostridia bacterium]|nr:Ldh family oxidoreductase [Clostridia bacterium]